MTHLDQLISEIFDDAADLTDDTPFASAPEWDSMKHVELVVGIEQRYGIELAADDIAGMVSRRAARDLLASRGRHD